MTKYNEEVLKKVEELTEPIYRKIEVWTHGWVHAKNVAKAAYDLAKLEGADPVLCAIAGYCHDLGRLEEERKKLVNPKPGSPSPHAGFSVAPTKKILDEVNINGLDADKIIEAVKVHANKKYIGDNEIANILQDADRSDGFGKIAILRFAAFNCEIPIAEPKDGQEIEEKYLVVLDELKNNKSLREKMIHTLEYVEDWYDVLLNTRSAREYIKPQYSFNKNLISELKKF